METPILYERKSATFSEKRRSSSIKGKPKKRNHVCLSCTAAFGQKAHLDTHVKAVHLGDKPFSCTICCYSSAAKGTLDKHVKTVHNKERPFQCQFCDRTFGQKAHVDAHINSIHMQERPYQCLECEYCCTAKGMLIKHVKIVHNKEKPFECGLCGKTFGQKIHLSSHFDSMHRKDKPYVCDVCDFCSSTRSALDKHRKNVHRYQKQKMIHRCPKCFSTFDRKFEFNNHTCKEVLFPMKCVLCDVTCTTSEHMKKHLLVTHDATNLSNDKKSTRCLSLKQSKQNPGSSIEIGENVASINYWNKQSSSSNSSILTTVDIPNHFLHDYSYYLPSQGGSAPLSGNFQ